MTVIYLLQRSTAHESTTTATVKASANRGTVERHILYKKDVDNAAAELTRDEDIASDVAYMREFCEKHGYAWDGDESSIADHTAEWEKDKLITAVSTIEGTVWKRKDQTWWIQAIELEE